jgi:uncharacterized protein
MESSTPEVAPDRQLIQGYGGGSFKISGVHHQGSLLVFPDRVAPWAVTDPAALDLEALLPVRDASPRPEILVLGTGAGFAILPQALRQAVREWGVVVEVMATPAACRTYNVLLAEERRVAAALIAMPDR